MTDEYLAELDRALSEHLGSVRDRENSAFDKLQVGCGNRADALLTVFVAVCSFVADNEFPFRRPA